MQTRELGSITYYSKIIIAISVPSYFRLSSGMVSGKMIIVTFFLSLKPKSISRNPQHGNIDSVLWYLVPFTLVVWWCSDWDEECEDRPMSVFNRLRGIRDFPTRNPAVLRSIACKISSWSTHQPTNNPDQICSRKKTNLPPQDQTMGIKTLGC